MLIKKAVGKTPALDDSVRLAETVSVIGEVAAAANVNIWYGSVLRGDVGGISIGENTNIQDNCTVHCAFGQTTTVGRDCVVGHNAVLHSCDIGDNCLIGMGAILLSGCVIGEGSLVGAGALVTEGKVIPPRSVVMGAPAKVVRQTTDDELAFFAEDVRSYCEAAQEQLLPPEHAAD